jgi:hypothetical protein
LSESSQNANSDDSVIASIQKLEEIKTILNNSNKESATPLNWAKQDVTNLESSQMSLTLCSKVSLVDKGIQVSMVMSPDMHTRYLKEKNDYLQNSNKDLTQDIKTLQDKIKLDREAFNYQLIQSQKEIDCHLNVIKDLTERITQLEELNANIASQNTNTENLEGIKSSSKHSVDYNINILADSHGRGLSQQISLKSNYQVFGLTKPGAKVKDILRTSTTKSLAEQNECTILLMGSNDVSSNEANNMLRVLKEYLDKNSHSDLLLCTIPLRYDLPAWSIVNKEIKKTNSKIVKLSKIYNRVKVIDISNLGRRFYTVHGQHLNVLGKRILVDRILAKVSVLSDPKRLETIMPRKVISLPWYEQGN